MLSFKNVRRAFRASKYGKAALVVLFAGLIVSSSFVGLPSNPAGATGNLVCSGPTTLSVNTDGTFHVTGGSAPFHWTAPQNVQNGPERDFVTHFPNGGTKEVKVTSGLDEDTCTVHVSGDGGGGGGDTAVSCSGPTTGAPDQDLTFHVDGGNGTFHWSAPQNVQDGPSRDFTTRFPNPGDKDVIVSSGDQSDTCHVHIASTLPPTPGKLSCTGPETLTVGEEGLFTGHGSTSGTYHWVAAQDVDDGLTFRTSFPNLGLKTINMSSGIQTGTCSVTVVSGGGGGGGGDNPPANCSLQVTSPITVSGGTASATVKNPAGCAAQNFNLASYKIYVAWNGSNNDEYIRSQRLFDQAGHVSLAPGESRTLSVDLPNCQYQVDLFKGIDPITPPFYDHTNLLGSKQEHNLPVCKDFIPPPPPQNPGLSCSRLAPSSGSANIGDPVTFQASGGNGSYSWTTNPDGLPSLSADQTFSTRYGTAGNKLATVRSGNQEATCQVNIIVKQIILDLSCSPTSQNVKVGQSANFVADGGSGSYRWSAPGGNPDSTDFTKNKGFSTVYDTTGFKPVTLFDSAGRSAICNVTVSQTNLNAPVCSPHNQDADIDEDVDFQASGGNGIFSWSAPGSSNTSGKGTGFTTSYDDDGTYVVTVTSNGLTDSCVVDINDDNNDLSCSPSNQDADVDDFVTFTAHGGSGTIRWTADEGDADPDSDTGRTFTTQFGDEGRHTVRVRDSAGHSDTCNVDIQEDFSPRRPSCSPSSQTAAVNEQVEFFANGGTGDFEWSAPRNASKRSGFSRRFTTSFSAPGSYEVELESNGHTDTCDVRIVDNDNNAPFCSPSTQNANVNDFVTFTATGGDGSFFWNTSADGSPATGNSSSFGTRFLTAGTKLVTVSSNGRTSQCLVTIGSVLGASTVVTGPTETAAAAAGLGFFGALGAYGAVYRERSKKILSKLTRLIRR